MDSGVDLHVYTRSRLSPTPGLAVHTVGGRLTPRSMRTAAFARRTERLLGDQRFDIVHAITPCGGVDIYQPRGGTVAESIERNLALVSAGPLRSAKRLANGLNVKQRRMLAAERRMLEGPDGPLVIAISDYVARQLRRHYGLADDRIRKVFNAVDVAPATVERRTRDREAIRREYGVPPAACLVLTIAHNFRLKGVQRWIEALALIVRRGITDVRSLVVGNGESRRWHRMALRLGVSDYLTFTGPTDRVESILHAGDVLVHPTYYDPCSRVVMEALVQGLVCITTRWDGSAELIEDGVSGFILDDPSRVERLAERVIELRDPSARRPILEAAREITGRLPMARHTKDVLALYSDLVADRSRGGRPVSPTARPSKTVEAPRPV
jgi:UDP-glucose:(heptosyl)LPS alpha-1,3-glucosyltransferase